MLFAVFILDKTGKSEYNILSQEQSRRDRQRRGPFMKLDLTQLMNKRIPSLSFDFSLRPEDVEDAPALPGDITLRTPVHVAGQIVDNDGYMALHAQVSVTYATVCDRCLDPLEDVLSFPLDRIVTAGAAAVENIDEDDVLWIQEGGIDFDREILEAVSLELPVYHLCSADCPGLCDICGKKRGRECTCGEKKEIDPRMEIFQKLLDKMEK